MASWFWQSGNRFFSLLESGKTPLVEVRNFSPKAVDSSTLPEEINNEELSITTKKGENMEILASEDEVDNTAGNNKKGSRKATVQRSSHVRVYTYKVA